MIFGIPIDFILFALTLLGVAQLSHPDLRLEVEVIAAKHDG